MAGEPNIGTASESAYLRLTPAAHGRLPGPELSWIRQLGHVRRDFLGYLSACAAVYGEMFCIRPGPTTRIWVLNSAALTHEVLTTRAAEFAKSAQTRLMVGKFLGQGLVLSDGDVHRRQRRAMQPSFGPREVTQFAAAVVGHARDACADWGARPEVDVEPELTALTLRIIVEFLTGEATTSTMSTTGAAAAAGVVFKELADAIGGRFKSMPLPSWVPTARNRLERRAIQRSNALVATLLSRPTPERGVLRTLAQSLAAGDMDRQEVRDHLVTLLFAGHETVNKVLTWSLYLLGRHPDITAKIRQELATVVGARPVTGGDLGRLRWLGATLKEAMRLFPPVWVFDRSARAPLTLGGQQLRPKDIVYVSPYLLHRQARYFAEPLAFKPERFVAGDGDLSLDARLPAGAYIPFGAGARVCIGQAFGFTEAALVLATILQRYDLEAADAAVVRPLPDATLTPAGPVRLRFRTALAYL